MLTGSWVLVRLGCRSWRKGTTSKMYQLSAAKASVLCRFGCFLFLESFPPQNPVCCFFPWKTIYPSLSTCQSEKTSTKKRLFSREILPGSVKLKKNLASVTALLRRATGSGSPNSSPRGASPNSSPRSGNDFWGWLRGFLGKKNMWQQFEEFWIFYPFEERISEMISTTISEKWSKTLMYLIRILHVAITIDRASNAVKIVASRSTEMFMVQDFSPPSAIAS